LPGSARDTPTRVLIVDDYDDALASYSELFEHNGFEVSTARDGLTALEMARRERPAVIVLDVALPKLDGYAVPTKIRADPDLGDTPVLMLTAFGGEDYLRRARRSRAREALTKPVLPSERLEIIGNLIGKTH